jgi:hypothetical protein
MLSPLSLLTGASAQFPRAASPCPLRLLYSGKGNRKEEDEDDRNGTGKTKERTQHGLAGKKRNCRRRRELMRRK